MKNGPAEFDVVVVGGGGSGLAAAVSAAQQGLTVLVLEKQQQPGGTTGIAVGSFTSSQTSLQHQANIADDPRQHAEDLARFAPPEVEARNASAMRDFFLTETAATFEWLRAMGLSFVGPSPEPPNRQPRMHNVVPGAKAYIARLQLELRRHGGRLLCDTAVEELLWRDRRVIGVAAAHRGQSQEFSAKRGVVLAAGDYANHAGMIRDHKGSAYEAIEGINPNAEGDGHRIAAQAGARLVNMDVTYGPELRFVANSSQPFQQWLPTSGWMGSLLGYLAQRCPQWLMHRMIKRLLVTWQHPEASLFDDGAILVNTAGKRFVDETSWPDREIAVANQPGKLAYIVLDQRLTQRYSAWPHFISTAPDIAYAYVDDYRRLRSDVTHDGRSPQDVAKAAGIDGDGLASTIDDWNESLPAGSPPLQPPWTLLGPVKAYFTTTEGGAVVDRQMRVLDDRDEVIEGLYAVGQNGLSGMILWSHGLHIAWALTSGRLAGIALACSARDGERR